MGKYVLTNAAYFLFQEKYIEYIIEVMYDLWKKFWEKYINVYRRKIYDKSVSL